ncbi:hypothetical protein E2C01_024869 [Portunus trituberculatus]|uniref:Uncharacterized protein n=1 Tax=Portunus trituberculatus TaxID=210409 RepID=A0A5B7EGB9_PORTR|nr:hypothetical protein [Portunus trituberculatus]
MPPPPYTRRKKNALKENCKKFEAALEWLCKKVEVGEGVMSEEKLDEWIKDMEKKNKLKK